MTKKTEHLAVTFTELAALQQKSRKPCGKQAFSLSQARDVAKVRGALSGTAWWVHVCYNGCGREIFHLTHKAPDTKKGKRFNKVGKSPSKRASKRTRRKRNQHMYQIMSVGTWEGEGGALDPQDMET